MAELVARDILKPRWNPAQHERAIRVLISLGILLVVVGLVGRLAAGMMFPGEPAGVLLLSLAPLITGVVLFVAAAVVKWAIPIGRLIRALAFPVFLVSVAGTVILVWVFMLVFGHLDHTAVAAGPDGTPIYNDPNLKTAFGGELAAKEIYTALPSAMRFKPVSWVLWPLQFNIVRDVLALGGIVGFVSIVAMFGIWWERKVAGRMQSRMGPMRVGGWHGWAQSMADGMKLITKEDLIPGDADRPLYRLAPYLAFVPALCAFIALPFGAYWVFRDLDVGLIFILAMLGIEVVGVILAGWASNNKWSVYGAMREACQMVSYEIPMGMSLLVPIMTAGALQLTRIGEQQSGGFHTWLAFSNPFVFGAMITYYIASLASCKRAPFDLPEGESELVAGYHTEYSGFRWSLFFFAEYAAMFAVSALATILFLGAWYSPLPASWGAELADGALLERAIHGVLFAGPIWFILKCGFLLYVQLWLRWTLPRIRIDQVLYACIQVLLPLAMVLLLGNTLWLLLVPTGGALDSIVNVVLTCIGAILAIGFVAIGAYGYVNRRRLVGSLAVEQLPSS